MRVSASAIIATAIVSVAFSQSPVLALDAIGKVAAAIGAPTAEGPGGDRSLSAGSTVYEDDKIVVRNGNAQIILDDGTKLVVGPGSTLVLDRFLMKGGNTAQKVSLKALRGTFRFISGRSAKSAYNIQTANATIGIRGTGFDFWVRQQTGAAVLDGTIQLCGSDGKGCVTVHEGCEMGRAGGNDAEKLTGRAKGRNISNYLPYILNQASLRTQFRLPIEDCKSSLSRPREGGDNNPGVDRQQRAD